MIVDKRIDRYLISGDASVQEAAAKISKQAGRIIFTVDSTGRLTGSLSNGDLIRWIAKREGLDQAQAVSSIANSNVIFASESDTQQKIIGLLSDVLFIPLLDREHRVKAVARQRQINEGIVIGGREISSSNPSFIIAEIGNNHNGDLKLALDLIRAAAAAGADCAKFQMRDMSTLYGADASSTKSEDLGTEYLLDLLGRFQLSNDDLFKCFDLTADLGMMPLCTAWDPGSAEACRSYGLPALKIASADLTNHTLLTELSNLGLPLICSSGMSEEQEIIETIKLLQRRGASYIFLHCNSTYPAPFKDINLSYIRRLAELSGGVVGYSGHERDIFVPVAAVTLGARVIEKHFTFDRSMEGNDHRVSLLPDEFSRMVAGIRQVELALSLQGTGRVLSQGERTNRISLSKSIFAARDIKAGTVIKTDMVVIRSPGQGIQPNKLSELLGKPAKRDIKSGTPFHPSDLTSIEDEPGSLRVDKLIFGRPWGIPVRHRDVSELIASFSPDLVEFHLSYRDLDADHHAILRPEPQIQLIVHAPELFRGDHLLDLCSRDLDYRKRSISELTRVIDTTKRLREFYQPGRPVGIITNVGGFSESAPLAEDEIERSVELLSESLRQLPLEGIQIWPQTMPPYPWHFGGQRFHNLFVDPSGIVKMCETLQLRICFDSSHSQLACNQNRTSFLSFVEAVAPYIAHMHLADARGVDGEGLQIGEGMIDFGVLFDVLDKQAPTASFIPEIWQGHENDGLGFKLALERLSAARSSRLATEKR